MMNNNEIKNPKTEVPSGIALNDKDHINSLLSHLKELVKNYAIALTEASNKNLYNKYKDLFDTYSIMQRETFELIFRKGWYTLEQSDNNKIEQKYQTLNQEFNDLNN